jgi:protein-L-isoaspartate(D-aspartate) O-methyltransferase
MLLLTHGEDGRWTARFVCGALFIPCIGARDDETAKSLTEAFQRGGLGAVKSLRRGTSPDTTSWYAGSDWWLSTVEQP